VCGVYTHVYIYSCVYIYRGVGPGTLEVLPGYIAPWRSVVGGQEASVLKREVTSSVKLIGVVKILGH
jgi:hypothetical protein